MSIARLDKSPKPPVGAYNPKVLQIGMGTRLYEREVNTTSPRKAVKKTYNSSNVMDNSGYIKDGNHIKDTSANVLSTGKGNQKLKVFLESSVPDYKKKSIRSPINFDVQLLRRQNINHSYDLEGNRFIIKKEPENWSKIRKLRNVEMQK